MQYQLTLLSLALMLSACGGGNKPPALTPKQLTFLAMEKDRLVQELDINGDGLVSCEDADRFRSEQFKFFDQNNDGRLTELEYREALFVDRSFMFFEFPLLNEDADNFISLEEFRKVPYDTILRYDQNEDCIVSQSELAADLKRQFYQGRLRPARPKREKTLDNGRKPSDRASRGYEY